VWLLEALVAVDLALRFGCDLALKGVIDCACGLADCRIGVGEKRLDQRAALF
jgi:hypothetical protein